MISESPRKLPENPALAAALPRSPRDVGDFLEDAALSAGRATRWQRVIATVALPAFLVACTAVYGAQATTMIHRTYVARASR